MSPQQFINRRQAVVSARFEHKSQLVRKSFALRPLVIVGVLVVFALFMRGNQQNDVKVAAVSPTVAMPSTSQTTPARAPFPALDQTTLTPVQRRLLALAKDEYAKNPVSYDTTVMHYTEGFKESWCADFVSWLRNEAGVPFEHPETGYWRIPGVSTMRDYYRAYNAYFAVGEYTPKLGDMAFYEGETPDGQNSEHVAMVLGVTDDTTLLTIGGNETKKGIVQVRTNKLALGERGLVGFGRTAVN